MAVMGRPPPPAPRGLPGGPPVPVAPRGRRSVATDSDAPRGRRGARKSGGAVSGASRNDDAFDGPSGPPYKGSPRRAADVHTGRAPNAGGGELDDGRGDRMFWRGT